ncbi:DUF1414 domain-containing protein [Pseudaeromonas sharmana]|uniref:UPF0352 protein ACFOSS_16355 n=1 Tax=Pseudaeromonas sharmana TaxID=328412 RepID=A0ABV8CS35_9GAMM
MPILSKFTNEQVESLVNELLLVLEKRDASLELSLLAIGNLATHLLNDRLPPAQRSQIAASFATALQQSVRPETH